jgi:hypothetical protein
MIAFDGLWSARKKSYADLIPYVEKRAREEPIFVFSTSVTPAFPVVNYSHARWPWRLSSQWFLPGFYAHDHDAAGGAVVYHSPAHMDALEKQFFNETVEGLIAHRPVLLLSDTLDWHQGFGRTRFDFLKYYGQDQRFIRFIAEYVDQAKIGQYVIFERRDGLGNGPRLYMLD